MTHQNHVSALKRICNVKLIKTFYTSHFHQQAVVEITRSFSTLELVAKNPSMMTKIAEFDDDVLQHVEVENEHENRRARRDVAATSAPNNAEQLSGTHLIGPYSPMYSGIKVQIIFFFYSVLHLFQ